MVSSRCGGRQSRACRRLCPRWRHYATLPGRATRRTRSTLVAELPRLEPVAQWRAGQARYPADRTARRQARIIPALPQPRSSFMRKFSSMLAVVFVLSAAPAFGQTAPNDSMAAARELIGTMKAADTFKAIMPSIVQTLKPAIVQNRPEVERDYDAMMPILIDGMSARLNEVIDKVPSLYARVFTASELREITAFYRGPAGQKFVNSQTLIMQESMVIGQQFGQTVAREMQSRIIEELRKRGHKI